ncbi:MAG TPA: toll/interleukin-1 receptor domain-containing protein [Bryobacteraceae bacterium]|nr:toll/interleukin-1 receptor domain-containing protein [Bryobacteraceae bacterium]
MSNVFISYRREDSAPYAGRICDRMESAFGHDHVFMDVDDIPPGSDFTEAISHRVSSCQALLVVIGPSWLELLRIRAAAGQQDFVALEIESALRRSIPVIPVLVGGAPMPSQRDLPETLSALSRRQALVVRDSGFDQDAGDLIRARRRATNSGATGRLWSWIPVAAAGVVAVIAVSLFWPRAQPGVVIAGTWKAQMQRQGLSPYQIRLRFEVAGEALGGQVHYPTGTAAIQGGTFDEHRLAFFTRHTPQFESEPATITFSGERSGQEIKLIATTPDGAVASGVARKVD